MVGVAGGGKRALLIEWSRVSNEGGRRFKSDLAGNNKFELVIIDVKEPRTSSFPVVWRALMVGVDMFVVVGADVRVCQAKRRRQLLRIAILCLWFDIDKKVNRRVRHIHNLDTLNL